MMFSKSVMFKSNIIPIKSKSNAREVALAMKNQDVFCQFRNGDTLTQIGFNRKGNHYEMISPADKGPLQAICLALSEDDFVDMLFKMRKGFNDEWRSN